MKPEVSIIVPVYNSEQYLNQCIDSLLNQTLNNIEIICVNDGSSDGSLRILKEYAARDSRIIIIDQPNQGVSVARNAGIKRIQGLYFMFVDSDDWLDESTCEEMYGAAISNNADCVMCSYVKEFSDHSVPNLIFDEDFFVWDKETVVSNFHRRLYGPIADELRHPESMDILVSPCMQLFKHSKYSEISFFDIREIGTFEDGLYQMDIYSNCDKFVYVGNTFYHYRKTNEDSITTSYKIGFVNKWMFLFEKMKRNIVQSKLSSEYKQALDNRICLSMIGLGLNQIKSDDGIINDAKALRKVLNTPQISEAFRRLDTSYFPVHWKLFFSLCKHGHALMLVLMLSTIEFLRKRVKK